MIYTHLKSYYYYNLMLLSIILSTLKIIYIIILNIHYIILDIHYIFSYNLYIYLYLLFSIFYISKNMPVVHDWSLPSPQPVNKPINNECRSHYARPAGDGLLAQLCYYKLMNETKRELRDWKNTIVVGSRLYRKMGVDYGC